MLSLRPSRVQFGQSKTLRQVPLKRIAARIRDAVLEKRILLHGLELKC